MRDAWRDAAVAGDVLSVERLLAEGANVNKLDRHGQTALMQAAMHGRDEVVRVLLGHDADPDVTAKYGLGALMLAVINHHVGIAKQLVDAGAATSLCGRGAPGFAGKTARQLAESQDMPELAAYIAAAEGNGAPSN